LDTETHGWQEMNVNVLSKIDAPFNDVVGTYTLRGYQVKVSKADGPPKGFGWNRRISKPGFLSRQILQKLWRCSHAENTGN
jgi:hypothetical protein